MCFLRTGLTGLLMVACVNSVSAQEAAWPTGTINLVVPLAAGGPVDALARIISDVVAKSSGRQIVVVNMVGAGGNIGAATVARAPPDGLTWLLTLDTVLTVNPNIYKNMGFDPDRDLEPVATIAHSALVLVVNPKNAPVKTLAALVTESRSKPVSFASAGAGTPAHLAFEYLRTVSGLQGLHVPYRGAAPALQDILSGAVDAGFIGVAPALPLIRSRTLHAVAVSTDVRLPMLPDTPSAAEAGLTGFDARFKFLLLTPRGVPEAVRRSFSHAIRAAVEDPKVLQILRNLSIEPSFSEGPAVAQGIADERRKWAEIVSSTGLREQN